MWTGSTSGCRSLHLARLRGIWWVYKQSKNTILSRKQHMPISKGLCPHNAFFNCSQRREQMAFSCLEEKCCTQRLFFLAYRHFCDATACSWKHSSFQKSASAEIGGEALMARKKNLNKSASGFCCRLCHFFIALTSSSSLLYSYQTEQWQVN